MALCKITKAAELAGVSVDTMRSYTDRGLIPYDRLEDGTRLFTSKSIAAAKKVRAASRARLHRTLNGG